MVFGLPISYTELLTYGGLGYTIGTLAKQNTIQKFSGHAIMAGSILYVLENYLGISL